jgi:hypothetical protein
MDDSDVVASIARHYRVGNEGLNASQLAQHEDHGFCDQCSELPIPLAGDGVRLGEFPQRSR